MSTHDPSRALTLSVIIPHLNQPDFLDRCLNSLKQQATASYVTEIIVVDNGSRELPSQICSAFEKVRLEHEAEAGPGPARNKGIAASTGDLLAFIDADCIANPDWLPTIHKTFSTNENIKVIGGDVRIAYDNENNLTMLEAYESVYAYRQKMYIEKQGFSGTGNLAMRRDVHGVVGPFAGIEVSEDRDWGRRATRAGYRIHYIPSMIVFHPARKTFAELCTKWDRHISHDFEDKAMGLKGRLRWIVLIVAIGLSPIAELVRIARSQRLHKLRERLLATICVTKIRLYRAAKMLALLFSGQKSEGSVSWNRN